MWEDQYFGGNGSAPDNCVTSGPFANRTLHVGPLEETTDYCFKRNWSQAKGLDFGARSHVDDCYEFDDFEAFYGCMAYYPHISGHKATGGVVSFAVFLMLLTSDAESSCPVSLVVLFIFEFCLI